MTLLILCLAFAPVPSGAETDAVVAKRCINLQAAAVMRDKEYAALERIALNENFDVGARLAAIKCLAATKNVAAYDFLVCNIEMKFTVQDSPHRAPRTVYPCERGLLYYPNGGLASDWNVPAAVIRNLDRDISGFALERLANVLMWSGGDEHNDGSYEHAVFLLEHEVKKKKNSDRKQENLKKILKLLKAKAEEK